MLPLIVITKLQQIREYRAAPTPVIAASKVLRLADLLVVVEPVPALDDGAAAAAEGGRAGCVVACLGAVTIAAFWVSEGGGASGLGVCGAGIFRLDARRASGQG